jgi:hypothetical protein
MGQFFTLMKNLEFSKIKTVLVPIPHTKETQNLGSDLGSGSGSF